MVRLLSLRPSRPHPPRAAPPRGPPPREPIDPADEPIGTNKGRPWLASHLRGLTPCPNLTTIDSSPNRCPLGRQLCLPISPTSRKTRAPSCSRLLTLPRPQTRLRVQRLLRPTRSGASGLKCGERDGSHRDRDRKWPLLDTLPTRLDALEQRIAKLEA